MMVLDPYQSHILIATSNYWVNHLSLYSGQLTGIGRHQRAISALSNVVIEDNCKVFYSGSRDGVIK